MTNAEPRSARSPVDHVIASAIDRGAATPIPLVATHYDIAILGGLAEVTARRTFRNAEERSIEACLTFPLPVTAVVYALTARIGERFIRGECKARSAARETYEEALDSGKTAVLHEEVLKGIHMLSVGHVAPGADVVVEIQFAVALTFTSGRVLLNIPLTAGQVYGHSGLPDSDDLVFGDSIDRGEVRVRCDSGVASLVRGQLRDGTASISLASPLIVEVQGWSARPLFGRRRNGQVVRLDIAPASNSLRTLNCAIVVDHSGSMGEPSGIGDLTKHQATLAALLAAQPDLTDGDAVHLFEFDDALCDLGGAGSQQWISTVQRLSGPEGGTEIGQALAGVLKATDASDIILITDGKSYAINVQALLQSGRRFHVVLIGEDSLEANVGHLAAFSSGELFAPDGGGLAGAIRSAFCAARAAASARASEPGQIRVRRAGMAIETRVLSTSPIAAMEDESRAIAAYSTGLSIPALSEDDAARIAEAEGLVTHLTSLILVDEDGVRQPDLAATRKVRLPEPACLAAFSPSMARSRSALKLTRVASFEIGLRDLGTKRGRPVAKYSRLRSHPRNEAMDTVADNAVRSLAAVAGAIDWSQHANALSRGDLSVLTEDDCAAVMLAACNLRIHSMATVMRLAPEVLVIALMARFCANEDRHADRLARRLLGASALPEIGQLAEALGLVAERSAAG